LLCDQWASLKHKAGALPYDRFANQHALFDCYEILFIRGYAGENSANFGAFSEANGSAYSSQEKKGSGNKEFFEMIWDPEKMKYTTNTTDEERKKVSYQIPKGLSGSLVWNTRYREMTENQKKWTPADAVITGVAQRWDRENKTLIVYRVEHVRSFIDSKLCAQA
jgi:hypothetical protein